MGIKTPSKIDIHHSHDSFFKKSLEDPRVVRDFLRAHLPKNTLSHIDLSCLEQQPSLHHKKVGKQQASDVVYKTKIHDEESYLYFSIEHQSHNDYTMAFRLLRYTIEIMETALATSKKLPLVIPLVVYHGKSECKMKMDIRDLIAAPKKLIDQYWLQPPRLVDLTKIDDQKLAGHQFASLMELALKSTYNSADLFYIKKIIEVYKHYCAEGSELNLQLVLEYLFVSNRKVSRQQFVETIHNALPENKDNQMLTIAEQCIEEGRQEGREEGYKRAQSEIRASLIARGLAPELIEEVIGHSKETIES